MNPGDLVVRRSIQIRATPERVWEEFADAARFRAWWGTRAGDRDEVVAAYEPHVGGRLDLTITTHNTDALPPGMSPVIEAPGRITVFEASRELSWEMGWSIGNWDAPTTVTVRLTPNAYGTLVEVLHWGFERIGAAAVDEYSGFEGGWDLRELRSLRDHIEAAVPA